MLILIIRRGQVNVVVTVTICIVDGRLAVRLVTFVRERPQRPTDVPSQLVALTEPKHLQHTWTDATPWPYEYVLPASLFFDWDDSALGRRGRPCPELHAATNVVISAEDMNRWCENILCAHRVEPLQRS